MEGIVEEATVYYGFKNLHDWYELFRASLWDENYPEYP